MVNALVKVLSLCALLFLGFIAASLVTLSTESLIVSCVDTPTNDAGAEEPLIAVPAEVFCHYLTWVRAPDPNAAEPNPLTAGPPQSLFGLTLSGHDPTNPRGSALIEYFIGRGIDWDHNAQRGLTPLHLAVLHHDASMIERFLAAGANPRTRAIAPGKAWHGLDPFDLSRLLRSQLKGQEDHDELQRLLGMEKHLCDDPDVDARAATTAPKFTLDPATHKVRSTDGLGESYSSPLENYEFLGSAIKGPLGDQTSPTLVFSGTWAWENVAVNKANCADKNSPDCLGDTPISPSRLEVLLLPDAGEEDAALWLNEFPLPSRQDRPGRQARLLNLEAVTVSDTDGDGQFEVQATARFALGCGGKPYRETFVLEIAGDQVTHRKN